MAESCLNEVEIRRFLAYLKDYVGLNFPHMTEMISGKRRVNAATANLLGYRLVVKDGKRECHKITT
jgi:hypothetical protein